MLSKNKTGKGKIMALLSLFLLLFSILYPLIGVFADFEDEDEDDANMKLNKEISMYLEDVDAFSDFVYKLEKDSKLDKNPNKDTILHILKRLFAPGEYLNDVEDGILSGGIDVSREDVLYNDRYLCNPNAPNNLINHNCNIPNFTTDLFQNIMDPITQPFNGADKTSSYALFGFGVPKDIPGGVVPVNPEHRTHTYTALELYGYNLPLISYNGEWDKINVSSEARMLSNFGIIDKVTLMGNGLWDSIRSGMGALIENFSFNPFRWGQSILKSMEAVLVGGINTVIDTSDLNIVATNAWKRDRINGTLYNIYVLTDKEVLIETNKKYFKEFIRILQEKAEVSPELLEVLELEQIPGFVYDPLWETDESIAAREAAEAHNSAESSRAASDEDYSPNYVTVPDPVYYTEAEQLGFWADDNEDILSRAATHGLISGNKEDYTEYEPLVEAWNKAWQEYFTREFNALGPVVNNLIEETDLEVFKNNPHLDPKQGISHYACANEDGSVMRNGAGDIEYLYLANNKGSQEYLNPKCGQARSPIGGGLLGSGWISNPPTDTRHIGNVGKDLSYSITNTIVTTANRVVRGVSSFLAQSTNTVIGMSFSPLIEELGISRIIAELIEGFRDTLFFPMATLVAMIGGVLVFLKLLQNLSAWQLVISILATFLIFVASATFLLYPEASLKLADEIPTKLESFLANAVLVSDDGSDYCSTGGDSDGIRSMQCNVWGLMVFKPWTILQFGTDYENLFANGYESNNGSSFQNSNSNLVGNAEVNMGAGHKVHNWALYQLDKTKAGTINNDKIPTSQNLGTVDKELFRLVDLQAGPNNGEGTDSRFFKVWSGQETSGFLGVLFLLQSILVSISIISISFLKIEASFVYSVSLVFLPIVMLYGLLPQGRIKLKEYMLKLLNFLFKRAIFTVVLVVLLKIYGMVFIRLDDITTASFVSIVISITFLIYKKELVNIMAQAESGVSKELIAQNLPLSIQNYIHITKSKVKAGAAGAIGGYFGAREYKKESREDLLSKQQILLDYKELLKEANKTEKDLDDEEKEKLNALMDDVTLAEEKARMIEDDSFSPLSQIIDGAKTSSNIIGRRTENQIRRKGFATDTVYRNAKEEVIRDGAESIRTNNEPSELDTYKKILSHSKDNPTKTVSETLSIEESRLLQDPKLQREIREMARAKKEIAKENFISESHKAQVTQVDSDELDQIAKYVDRKRRANNIKGVALNRGYEKDVVQKDAKEKADLRNIKSNVEEIIKDKVTESMNKDPIRTKKSNYENPYSSGIKPSKGDNLSNEERTPLEKTRNEQEAPSRIETDRDMSGEKSEGGGDEA